MTKRGVLFLLIVVLLSSSVFAIGISPAKVHHDFQPGLSYTKEFRAWNTLTYPIDISLSVEGDLAEYMSLSEPYLKDLQPNESRVFYLSMNLPAQLESGGLKMSYVRATEEKRNDRGTISVRGAVRTRVEVKVAIEGKSVEITSLDTENVAQGAPSYFEGTAHNYGTEKINRMDGYAEVFDQEGKSLFNTKIKSYLNIESYNGEKFFTQIPCQSWGPGRYIINFKVDYDGKSVSKNTSFIIGELKIDVFNLTEEIESGKIEDFKFRVKNKWNEKVKDTYAEIRVYDDYNTFIQTKTHTFDVGPWEEKEIETFLNGKKLKPGNYQVEVKLNYADKNTIASSYFTVKGNELEAKSGKGFNFPEGNGIMYGLAALAVLMVGSLISMNLLLLKKLNQAGPRKKRKTKK